MEQKVLIRKKALQNRRNLTTQSNKDKSAKIIQTLCQQQVFQNADIIFAYASSDDEVQTFSFIQYCLDEGKRIALPKVTDANAGKMKFYEIDSLNDLEEGFHGIKEPRPYKELTTADLCMIPGVAFDLKRNRIGYGKGFYDRFLKEAPDTMATIAIAFECQMFDGIVADQYDQKPDCIITEERVIR